MKVVTIIQARVGSTRLPGKVLKPLDDSNVLSYVVERCRRIEGVGAVVVATSDLQQDDAIAKWCEDKSVAYYRGSEQDVLDRYVQAAKPYQPDYVMRVTSDCPFVDYEMASDVVSLMEKEQKDIVLMDGELPRGLAVELISYEALLHIHEVGKEPRHREHVTYFAYEYAEKFNSVTYKVPSNRLAPELRITLDTPEDYQLISAVANHFNDALVSSSKVIKYLRETPEVATLNAHIEQKPVI
ncbi:acylneuraminate cytidylyltransferase [Lysinibacillus sphaericus]|uniref:cytidylyltransferase domain-containing protein n=1 Tax=Lysinibacillus sphaericus TaxID=1421 RepID=UPI0018CCCB68|nr:glycosyltransferase family protein [Lysinibacillus sphaericus]MBG9454830.1 acylneuraminate cytidylyltransferase [Lysinibacillus sphaericus]MBG9478258.1 acylneuraminate cytidylyltransferase [Lysinibacillus sphaericus]MBG9590971.1 acylneuraminate cytidylyltransferase [Lysinibacillus sphaericus]